MLKIYYTLQKTNSHEFLFAILKRFYGIEERLLLYTQNGKPYLPQNSVFFSISHTSALTAVAVSEAPVGLDVEYLRRKGNYTAILNRFSPREKGEITDMAGLLINWTAKESYVKFRGEKMAYLYDKLEYANQTLFLEGQPLFVVLQRGTLLNGEYCYHVCSQTKQEIETIEFN